MRTPERIAELLFRHLRGELTEGQQRELDAWRKESTENERAFHEETNPGNIRQEISQMYNSKDRVWQKMLNKNPEIAGHSRPRQLAWNQWAAAILLIAAGVATFLFMRHKKDDGLHSAKGNFSAASLHPGGNHAVLTLASGRSILLDTANEGTLAVQGRSTAAKADSGQLIYKGNDSRAGHVFYNLLTTPRGGEFRLVLSDGTKVWLNAASTIKYPTFFDSNARAVEITGEAYFEVAKDPSKPFRVKAPQGSIEVLGTHFNVMSYSDEPFMAATLLEGKVKINAAEESRIMEPGDEAKIAKGKASITIDRSADAATAIAWKNGRILFRDEDIQSIMRMISRWYDVDVDYKGAIPSRSITGGISRNASMDDLLKILELNKIHFMMEGKKITIEP